MHLHDKIMSASALRLRGSDGVDWVLPAASDLKEKIKDAPVRYVLDNATCALVTQSGFSDGRNFDEFLDVLRFPSMKLWMEWNETGRNTELARLGLKKQNIEVGGRGRAGAYIEADENGRRAKISIVWENDESQPDLSPFIIYLDLDDPTFSQTASENSNSYALQIEDFTFVAPILARAKFDLRPEWSSYYRRYACSQEKFINCISQELSNISDDVIFICTFFLILQASGAFVLEQSDLNRLNAARRVRRKAELLDYVNVSLNLRSEKLGNGPSDKNGRTVPRLHHVCGHLVRRGGTVFWRRAHLRGNPDAGIIRQRTVIVKGDGASPLVNSVK